MNFAAKPIGRFMTRYWFFISIAFLVLVAFQFPVLGTKVKEWHVLKIGIFIAFLITGLTLETRSIIKEISNLKTLLASLISSLVLFPLIAFFLANRVFSGEIDFIVGVLIIAVAPVTVASGTVMTGIAGGNIPLSLFICILGNVTAIVTIPFSLNLFLQSGQHIDLPVFRMIQSLIFTVLIPTVIGQILRIWLKDAIGPFKKSFSVFSQIVVLLIIFNAVSSSSDRLWMIGFRIVSLLAFMAALHMMILALNYGITRLLKLDYGSRAAFTIHTSQKTLTVSYLVWAGFFADGFPLAMIPGIGYHLTQMIMDTVVAHRMRMGREKAGTPSGG